MIRLAPFFVAGGLLAMSGVAHGVGVEINEIRIDQPGGDNDEYFELAGAPLTPLTGLTYIVIGDGGTASGTIEAVIDLTGQALDANGFFVAAEATFTIGTANLTTTLNFENSDNVTHLLVSGFTGMNGDDLDVDDDGILDTTPWASICDCIALIETVGTGEMVYCLETIGPDGIFVPGHVFRDATSGAWTIGAFDPAAPEAADTPGAPNGNAIMVDITVNKTGPVVATGGAMITYTLTVANEGAAPAAGISIVDTLPAGMAFSSETSPVDVVLTDSTAPTIEWTMVTLAAQTSVTIELTVLLDNGADGDLVNTLEATSTTPEDFPGANIDEVMTCVNPPVTPPAGLRINEIRVDQPADMTCTDTAGGDCEEFVEFKGTPNTDLSGLTYLVIGDGNPALGSGLIEEIICLRGLSVQPDGYFVIAEKEWTGQLSGTVDLSRDLRFENSDNQTHLLVANFTGGFGDDLDVDDDGDLDLFPWSSEIDVVGIIEEANPPVSTEFSYGDNLGFEDIGPDGMSLPGHIYRCETDGNWLIGLFDPLDPAAKDTPDADNPLECGGPIVCPGDTDGNLMINVDDIVNVVLDFGLSCFNPACPNNGDVDGSGTVDVDDIVLVVLNFGNTCP